MRGLTGLLDPKNGQGTDRTVGHCVADECLCLTSSGDDDTGDTGDVASGASSCARRAALVRRGDGDGDGDTPSLLAGGDAAAGFRPLLLRRLVDMTRVWRAGLRLRHTDRQTDRQTDRGGRQTERKGGAAMSNRAAVPCAAPVLPACLVRARLGRLHLVLPLRGAVALSLLAALCRRVAFAASGPTAPFGFFCARTSIAQAQRNEEVDAQAVQGRKDQILGWDGKK
jgi:hypothetical protein